MDRERIFASVFSWLDCRITGKVTPKPVLWIPKACLLHTCITIWTTLRSVCQTTACYRSAWRVRFNLAPPQRQCHTPSVSKAASSRHYRLLVPLCLTTQSWMERLVKRKLESLPSNTSTSRDESKRYSSLLEGLCQNPVSSCPTTSNKWELGTYSFLHVLT